MNQLFSILIISFLLFSCNTESEKKELKLEESKENETKKELKNSLITTSEKGTQIVQCDCEIEKYSKSYSTDLIFQHSKLFKEKNDSLFAKYSTDSLKNQIKSIRFSGFDTIPIKFSVFKEVNRLTINSRNGTHGIDIFPKLKTVYFWGSDINLNNDDNWLHKIEALFAEKTKFTGLDSFSKMPNLNTIYFSFSGFDNFPNDFDELDCLNEIVFGAYMFGKLDLNKLDLSKNKCLRKVQFHAYQNTLNGIPKGLLNSKVIDFKINHQKLTEKEKSKLQTIKASR